MVQTRSCMDLQPALSIHEYYEFNMATTYLSGMKGKDSYRLRDCMQMQHSSYRLHYHYQLQKKCFPCKPFLKTPHLYCSTCHIWHVDTAREALMDVKYDRCTRHWQVLVIWYFSFLAGEEGEAHPGWYFLSFPMRQFIIIMNGVSIGLEFAWAWWMVGSVRVSTSKQLAFNAE